MAGDGGGTRRRSLMFGVAGVLVAMPAICGIGIAAEQPVKTNEMIVTLLGTGSPQPNPKRFGPATLVQAGGLSLLFDAGRGVTIRLSQLGVSSGKGIDAIFLTHYHSDHLGGLPDLWMTGYIFGPFGSRAKPLRLWGPSEPKAGRHGAARIAKGLTEAFADDIRMRQIDEGNPTTGIPIEAHEFDADGVVFDEAGVKVTAFAVSHGELRTPSVGYRVDHGSRSVTISGDTKPAENLIKHAGGTDVLIHEVFTISEQLAKLPQLKHLGTDHTSPEQAGTVFARAKPKLGVYSHLVTIGTNGDDLVARTRGTYQGPLEVGEDLMRFVIGDGVTVKKWNPELQKYPD